MGRVHTLDYVTHACLILDFQSRETMLQEIEKAERHLMALQPLRYKTSVATDTPKLEDVIVKALSTSKVLEFEKMFEQVPDLKTAGKDGRTVAAMLKLLQSRVCIINIFDITGLVFILKMLCESI